MKMGCVNSLWDVAVQDSEGMFAAENGYKVDGKQVIGKRQPAIPNAPGGLLGLLQLPDRLNRLLQSERNHGLIEPNTSKVGDHLMPKLDGVNSNSNVFTLATHSPTPGSTVTLDVEDSPAIVFYWTAGENETVNISGTPEDGRFLLVKVQATGLTRTISFGDGFNSSGNLVILLGQQAVGAFIAVGGIFYEITRNNGL